MKFQMLKNSKYIEDHSEFNLTKKITSDNIQLSPGKKKNVRIFKKILNEISFN